MKKIDQISANVQADKEIMKRVNANTYTSIDSFIEQAKRYISATKEGRMLCIIESVSSSGMSRKLRFLSVEQNKTGKKRYNYCNFWSLFKHLGYSEARNDRQNFTIHGCGMDMVFNTHYNIIHKLHRLGFINRKECDKLAQDKPNTL